MIDESLAKKFSIGQDGFTWWLGQVCESENWLANYPSLPLDRKKDLPGFKRRVKVSILGWHSTDKNQLKNDELPWAYCLLPVTAGGGWGGLGESVNLSGGEWVFGFFLDGSDGQQPVIIGVLDKSTQEDYRDDIPEERYQPFSGYSNKRVVPLENTKTDDAVEKEAVGEADVSEGDNGVQRTKTNPKECLWIEQGNAGETYVKSNVTCEENLKATGEMLRADNSPCNNPMAFADRAMKRLSTLKSLIKKYDGIQVDLGTNKISDELMKVEEELCADAVATSQALLQTKIEAKTLEAASKTMSKVATFAPLSEMVKAMDANEKASDEIIKQFNNIKSKLPSESMGFVKEMASKIISQPPCVVESYMGSLTGNSLGKIDASMNKMMGSVNNVISKIDKLGSLSKMGLGDAGAIGPMLSEGLNAFGGISIDMDGITKFTTSYKKLLPGEAPLPCPEGVNFNALDGGFPIPPSATKIGNMLENVATDLAAAGQLKSGISNFMENNSLFSTALTLDNVGLGDVGGTGGLTDLLDKARNLDSFKKLPGTMGDSIIESSKSLMNGGKTVDVCIVAANRLYPGAGDVVREAFKEQLAGQRTPGGSCETGPILNGPPLVKIFGGSGNGATANAVIGPNGNLLAVDVTRGGKGFTSIPFIAITDSSGKGSGAVVKASVGYGGSITDITVVSPGFGYTSTPTGAVGGNGRTFAEGDGTVLKDKEGSYYSFVPGTGIKIPPGGTVYLPTGSKVELPTSALTTDGDPIFDSNQKEQGRIKSVQVNLRKAFKGFGKVTDGSVKGAGPVLSIRDAVTDRKISNLIEVQTGRPFNIDYVAPDILDEYTKRNILQKEGRTEEFDELTAFGKRRGDGSLYGLVDPKSTDEEWVREQYHSLFCREPDAGGYRYWLNDLKKGHSRATVLANMKIATTEYQDHQAKIKSGEVDPEKCKFRWRKVKKEIPPVINNFRTLDPWRANLAAGTILTFRGVYNHHEPLTAAQLEDPYDLTRGNYRYFVFDYVVEVYDTPTGYGYAEGTDTEKTKWFKLKEIKYVTGTKDFVNGEVVTKWMRDYKGRLYEMHITVCTYDDDKIEVTGHGLATNSEVQEVIRTALPCKPPITRDKLADYQPVRWYREKPFRPAPPKRQTQTQVTRTNRTVSLNFAGLHAANKPISVKDGGKRLDLKDGHGTDANASFIIDSGNVKFSGDGTSIVGAGKATITLRWNDNPNTAGTALGSIGFGGKTWTQSGRSGSLTQTVDIGKMVETVTEVKTETTKKTKQDTNIYTDEYVQGEGHIPGTERNELVREIIKVYNSFGEKKYGYAYKMGYFQGRMYADRSGLNYWVEMYLDKLRGMRRGLTCETEEYEVKQSTAGQPVPVNFKVKTASYYADSVRIEGLNINIGKELGPNKDIVESVTRQVEYGKVYSVVFNSVQGVERLRNNGDNIIEMEDLPPDRVQSIYYDDIVIESSIGKFYNIQGNTCSFRVDAVTLPSIKKKRVKKTTPLSEVEYLGYKNNLNQTPEPNAFNCVKKTIYAAAKINFEKYGQVIKEETYCDWGTKYVEEVQSTFKPTNTLGYILPCGGEITAPPGGEEPPPPSGDPKIIVPKTVEIVSTGIGYTPGDTVSINGDPVEFETDPDGRIIKVKPPRRQPVFDYPIVEIDSPTGAGADIEMTLEALPPTSDELTPDDILPANIVEVIDCVGKNIFIKES